MIDFQRDFTDIEAQAILSMIAQLATENYIVKIEQGELTESPDDTTRYYPYVVIVIDWFDNEVVCKAQAYRLADALQAAYSSAPERAAVESEAASDD